MSSWLFKIGVDLIVKNKIIMCEFSIIVEIWMKEKKIICMGKWEVLFEG
jgi:hypothetical protein